MSPETLWTEAQRIPTLHRAIDVEGETEVAPRAWLAPVTSAIPSGSAVPAPDDGAGNSTFDDHAGNR